jgi:transcription antitermination protein NusB
MSTRREARERALGLCYEVEVRNVDLEALLADLPAAPDAYAVDLARGVAARRDELDALLGKFSEHWAVDRMPAVDRAILRIGCYELEQGELPAPVVISEAVELAKQYSTKDSGRFVNGLLARIADELGKPTA